MLQGFSLRMYGAFANEEEFIGIEWIRRLHEISKANNLNLFSMQVRYTNKHIDPVLDPINSNFCLLLFQVVLMKLSLVVRLTNN